MTQGEPQARVYDGPVLPPSEPIAIVGMSCRWPGGVRNPSQLWDLLKEKRDGWAEFGPDHINVDGFYHPNGQRPGSMFTRGGHVLREDPRQFDHSFFGMTATETMSMDPSQRKLLEVTYEAFESAGEPLEKFVGSKTGVFVGNFNNDHHLMQTRDPDHTLPYVVTGGGTTILSNRINYVFNLQGPSLVVDTGCSASMYALHLAVLSMQNGDCDRAIVAGGNIILTPDGQVFTTKLGALSPTSRCHTFDASADGYARADGFGALYLKKLSDAIANGDPIRAVVRGTAFNANGKTGGISHPSPEGQEAVIRQAYKIAGNLDPSQTGYFECHGTGTPVGDPIEVAAIGRVFAEHHRQDEPLLIGSIKPNLGHSESASAMSQIMKGILAMERGEIPATIGIENFNPSIDFENSRVKVVTDMTAWPTDKLRRVSINSFGYGGANAHCILDHPSVLIPGYQLAGLPQSTRNSLKMLPYKTGHIKIAYSLTNGQVHGHTPGHVNGLNNGYTNGRHGHNGAFNGNGHAVSVNGSQSMAWLKPAKRIQKEQAGTRQFILMPFSAHDDQALKTNIASVSDCLNDFDLADLVYTLGARKSTFSRRAFVVKDSQNLGDGLTLSSMTTSKTSTQPVQRIGFVFTGQGAQWPEMGARLIHEYAAFRQAIRYLDQVLQSLDQGPSWSIEQALSEPAALSRIHDPEFSQTVCTALQIALVSLLKQWGIEPAATVGHSSGEIAAAYAAGRLRASEAVVLAYFRGQVVATNQHKGLMIAIGLGPEGIASFLEGIEEQAKIAAVNSPDSVTVSGEPSTINELAVRLGEQGVFHRILKTGDNAYHSHHMRALGGPYEERASLGLLQTEQFALKEPARPLLRWVSSVTPHKEVLSAPPAYWRQNLESPVLFSHAVQVLAKESPVDLMIEIGPHPALGGPLKQIRSALEKSGLTLPSCLATLRRGEHDATSMLTLAGQLFLNNAPVDLVAVNATEKTTSSHIILKHGHPCIDMPQYNFTYTEKPIYYENRYNKEHRLRKHPRHDLLGSKQPGCSRTQPSWRNVLRMKDLPWLADHKLLPHAVLPGAAYMAMAIEAVRQMHHEAEEALPIKSFKLRNVAINSTLRIDPDDVLGVETVLNMERVPLTHANAKSVWYKFSIGSIAADSDVWTEHCTGTISVETRETTVDDDRRLVADSRSRSLDLRRWYDKFEEVGLGYGPTFQGLSNLQAYRSTNVAAANIALNTTVGNVNGGESAYAIHPATLDNCLQLALISSHAGQVENVDKAFVPIFADNVSVWVANATEESGWGVASGQTLGLRGLYARAQLFSLSGTPLVDIGELKCVTYDGVLDASAGGSAATVAREPYLRTVSRVDISTLTDASAKAMFPPQARKSDLNGFDMLCGNILTDIEARLDTEFLPADRSQTHDRFSEWIRAQAGSLLYGTETCSNNEDRARKIDEMVSELAAMPEARSIKKLHGNLSRILRGETNSIKVLMEDDLLQELYSAGSLFTGGYAQAQHLVDLLAHKNPKMRILEIGGGTAAMSAAVLGTLESKTAFKRFDTYTFTDPAAWSIPGAETKLKGCSGLSFQTLDIQIDPVTQGFEADPFDLVIASGSFSHISQPAKALEHIRSLLKPGGKLLLQEITQQSLGSSILIRTINGNWDDKDVLQSGAEWHDLLRATGFSGADITLDDYPESQAISNVILSTATAPVEDLDMILEAQGEVYLVYRDSLPPIALAITEYLTRQGFEVRTTNLLSHQDIPSGSSVVSLVDFEDSTLLNSDEVHFQAIQEIITKAMTIVWVATSDAAKRPSEPAVIKGMLRSIATENVLLKVALVEMEYSHLANTINAGSSTVQRTAELIAQKFTELNSSAPGDSVDRDCLIRDGAFFVERILPDETLNENFRLRHGIENEVQERRIDDAVRLRANYKQPGVLSSLYFSRDTAFDEPLRDDWVEIKTEAIGLNMKDLAVATARFDWEYLSTEAAGIVTQVGTAVTSLKVGDRVFGMVFGNMGNYTRSAASVVAKIPDGQSPVDAASMPVVYLTALYALQHLARLEKGESVLIQAATGGLGMAAIRVARHLGAEVYATVGNDEKRRILTDEFGIPSSHIFNSRELSSVDDILRATNRQGIDVVLASSAGDLMHETWRCIAPMGRFIDVGRTDVLGGGKLALEVFKRNATFSSFDISLVLRQKPAVISRWMQEVKTLWENGTIGPINHITTFDISKLEAAMSFFAKGVHTGKLVITFQDPETKLKTSKMANMLSFDPDAAYILVGCLGGLGRSLAVWMVEHQARHLVFLSRSGADRPETAEMVEELTRMGAEPEIIRCDATDLESVKSAVDQVSNFLPIKGIINAAMVAGDALFHKANFSQIHGVLAPKVAGSINLHHATKHIPLDFFLMTSSIVATVGTSTQAAYAAGNAFQDDFARFRLAQNLPATSLSLGLILEVGSVRDAVGFQRLHQHNASYGISETEFLQLLEGALCQSSLTCSKASPYAKLDPSCPAQVIVGLEPGRFMPYIDEDRLNDLVWLNNTRFQAIRQAISDRAKARMVGDASGGSGAGSSLAAKLRAALTPEERTTVAREAIIERLALLLSIEAEDIDSDKPLAQYGFDSLIAAELRNWLIKGFGVEVSLLKLLAKSTKISDLVTAAAAGKQ